MKNAALSLVCLILFVRTWAQRPDSLRSIPDTARAFTNTLEAVQVTGRKSFMRIDGDKKTFDVAAMGAVAGADAAAVMRQIPLVEVDRNGDLTLRGKPAGVLIDGKPSPYPDVATALQMIPASAIDKVEVITNPSAAYDAAGPGGIVNIVMKKDRAEGFRGLVNLDAATLPDYHAGTDIHLGKGPWNISGSLNDHYRYLTGDDDSWLQYGPPDTAAARSQTARLRMRTRDADARLGIDYTANGRTTLSLVQSFSRRRGSKESAILLDSGRDAKAMRPYGNREESTGSRQAAYEATASLLHTFRRPGRQLTADIQFTDDHTEKEGSFVDGLIASGMEGSQWNDGTDHTTGAMAQAGYTDEFRGGGKLEAGYKGSYRLDRNNRNAWTSGAGGMPAYDSIQSGRFRYSEQVQAAYILYSGKLAGLGYRLGLRTELARLDGQAYLPASRFSRSFFNVFPDLSLSSGLGPNATIALSYATRITRPAFRQLLAYVDETDPATYTAGNPDLSPAYTHQLELDFNKSFAGGDIINLSLYYSATQGAIQPVVTPYAPGILLSRPQNTGTNATFGGDLLLRFHVTEHVRITSTFGGRYARFAGSPVLAGGNGRLWTEDLRLSAEADLPGRLLLLLHGDLSSPQPLPQGYSNDVKGMDGELRRNWLRGRITTALILSDILNDRRTVSRMMGPGFIQNEVDKLQGRMVHLHVSYRFGRFR
jgi:outer membrane receptor protein involved in Fe transport